MLLSTSGLTGLQTASLVAALPFTIVILFMIYGFIHVMKQEPVAASEPKQVKTRKSKDAAAI